MQNIERGRKFGSTEKKKKRGKGGHFCQKKLAGIIFVDRSKGEKYFGKITRANSSYVKVSLGAKPNLLSEVSLILLLPNFPA